MKQRTRKRIVIGLAGVVLAVVVIGAGCADRFILPPVPRAVAGDGSERITIGRDDGGVIEVFRARSSGAERTEPRAFVIRFTGDANTAAKFTASRWGERAIEAWVVNYPGYGTSTGPRTLKAMAGAALMAFDELRRVAGDRPIILEGFSLGTVPALHVAANRNVAGLILQNGPPLRQHILRSHGWWNLWLLAGPIALRVPREFDSLANARGVTAPAVYVIADRDRSIPPKLQQLVYDAHAGEKRLIVQAGADQVDPLDEATLAQLHEAMDWLLAKAAAAGEVGATRPAR